MNLTILLTSCTDDSKLVSIQHSREFSQVFTLVQLLGGRKGREGGMGKEEGWGGRKGRQK